MNLHYLQHVPFEGLGCIEEWAPFRQMQITGTRLYAGEHPPSPSDIDWLVILGGPMGIHDHCDYPWLVEEKAVIKAVMDAGKTVVGICLGAQLIADVLGASVYPAPHKEIGWFPLRRAAEAPAWIPEELTAFHWHGDTFDLPAQAIRLASSDVCINQGFICRDRVIGLQFHLESTPDSMEALIRNCGHELVDAPGIQTADQMRAASGNFSAINSAMHHLLNHLLNL